MDHKVSEEGHVHAPDMTCHAIVCALRILITGKNGHDVWPRLERVKNYLSMDWVTFNTHFSHLETAGKVVVNADKTSTFYNTVWKVSRRVSLPEYVD